MVRRPYAQSPEALSELAEGVDRLARLLACTLGPSQSIVLNATWQEAPETLTDSSTIARRVIEIPGRGRNVGAMLLRHAAWQMRERYGDGAATAAVIARAMVREVVRRLAAGAGPVLLERGIECGLAAAARALNAQAVPVGGQEMLTRLAAGVTGDPKLGEILGEMFDIMGEHAAFSVEEYVAPYLDREYLDGGRWPIRPASRVFVPESRQGLTLQNPLVLVAGQELSTIEHVQGWLETVSELPHKPPLVVVARDVTDQALQMLAANHEQGRLNVVAAIPTALDIQEDLEDVAIMTGAEVVSEEVGRSPERTSFEWLGRARSAVFTAEHLTIIGGGGEPMRIRRRVSELRARVSRPDVEQEDRDKLRMRMSRLSGGAAVLKIGAYTEREREEKKEQANKAMRVLELALQEGAVPGGGVAYLACVPAVREAMASCGDPERAAGMDVVIVGLEAPFLQLVTNHGVADPRVALAEVGRMGEGYGFDARTGQYADMARLGVLDALAVARGALEAAGSIATTVATTGCIVFLPEERRETSVNP